MFVVKRSKHNPILLPVKDHPWEASATFNWSPVKDGGTTHVLYRAMAHQELMGNERLSLSVVGHGCTTDGVHFDDRNQLIFPEHDWEKYGCEDPRVTKLGDTYYIFYTAISEFPFRAEGIKCAVALTKDFKTIEAKHLVTPFNAKAMTLFPEKINGKYVVALSIHTDMPPTKIAFASFDRIDDIWAPEYWGKWYSEWEQHTIDPTRREHDHVEVGATPILTEEGWLFIYSHIQEYGHYNQTFGIDVLLLDRDDPKKIIGRTAGALLVPEALYEERGNVENIVFPSGALIRDDMLEIYYGAADTTCARASVHLSKLLASMLPDRPAKRVERYEGNPIITPIPDHDWEAFATFNPAAIKLDDKVHIIYRAMSHDGTSTMGMAISSDGLHVDERLPEPIYVPRESFEMKSAPGNSGCEDPRIVEMDNGKLYMFYTAFDGIEAPGVAVTSIEKEKFLERDWGAWAKPILITPPGVMDKDTAIFPEKIRGKYLIIHRISDVICADYFETLIFENEKVDKCLQIVKPRRGMWDGAKVGIAGPPIKTEHGWLQLYHGVSTSTIYRLGALLFDLENPTEIIARTTAPIMEPVCDYEIKGQVDNVVFPCGQVEIDGILYIYYGGADSVVGVATVEMEDLFDMLKK